MMISIHYPKISIKEWRIEEDDEKYNIVVSYPKNTPFTCNQLCLIEQVNQFLIGEILIQPYDDRTDFITEVYKTGERPITVQELKIIQRRIEPEKKRKRVRINNNNDEIPQTTNSNID